VGIRGVILGYLYTLIFDFLCFLVSVYVRIDLSGSTGCLVEQLLVLCSFEPYIHSPNRYRVQKSTYYLPAGPTSTSVTQGKK
jgi:hypothetical protein